MSQFVNIADLNQSASPAPSTTMGLVGSFFQRDQRENQLAQQQVNQNVGTTVSTTAQLAAKFMTAQGKKSSDALVKVLTDKFVNYTDENMYDLVFGCKKYSMKQGNFAQVMASSLNASAANLKELGVADADINNSRPRQVYTARGNRIQTILKEKFWDKGVPDNALSWGNFMRIPVVETFMREVRNQNQTLKPRAQAILYSNSYWMIATFEEAHSEQIKRLIVVCQVVTNVCRGTKVDNKGKVTEIDSNLFKILKDQLAAIRDTTQIGISGDANSFANAVKTNASLTLGMMIDAAILIDPRKLLQTKTYRMSRTIKGVTNKSRLDYDLQVIEMMQVMIMLATLIVSPNSTTNDLMPVSEAKLTPRSDFGKLFYRSYGIVHTFIRTLKSALLGITGGADTRSQDEDQIHTAKTWNEIETLIKNVSSEKSGVSGFSSMFNTPSNTPLPPSPNLTASAPTTDIASFK